MPKTNPLYKAYSNILGTLEKLIDAAQTKEAKFALVTKKLSKSKLTEFIKGKITFEEAISEQKTNGPRNALADYPTNALAIAICLGKVESVEKILTLFDCKSIDERLMTNL